MREIFFRGKDRMSGEWVYGDLYQERHSDGTIKTTIVQPLSVYNVDPDTVGQYTGSIDRNGKKIFEGDILEYTVLSNPRLGDVKFAYGAFYLSCVGYSDEFFYNCGDKVVIGNIHDNSELIK